MCNNNKKFEKDDKVKINSPYFKDSMGIVIKNCTMPNWSNCIEVYVKNIEATIVINKKFLTLIKEKPTFNKGDKVKVLRKEHNNYTPEWDNCWEPEMDKYINGTHEVIKDKKELGIALRNIDSNRTSNYCFPRSVLELIKEEKEKTLPYFHNAKKGDRVVSFAQGTGIIREEIDAKDTYCIEVKFDSRGTIKTFTIEGKHTTGDKNQSLYYEGTTFIVNESKKPWIPKVGDIISKELTIINETVTAVITNTSNCTTNAKYSIVFKDGSALNIGSTEMYTLITDEYTDWKEAINSDKFK